MGGVAHLGRPTVHTAHFSYDKLNSYDTLADFPQLLSLSSIGCGLANAVKMWALEQPFSFLSLPLNWKRKLLRYFPLRPQIPDDQPIAPTEYPARTA